MCFVVERQPEVCVCSTNRLVLENKDVKGDHVLFWVRCWIVDWEISNL